jgi:hypothetical protein
LQPPQTTANIADLANLRQNNQKEQNLKIINKLTGKSVSGIDFNSKNGIMNVFKTFNQAYIVEIILRDPETKRKVEHWTNETK